MQTVVPAGEACTYEYGSEPQDAILHMCAHFGWPAAWRPLLGQLMAALPIPRSSREGLPHTQLIRTAVQMGEQCCKAPFAAGATPARAR